MSTSDHIGGHRRLGCVADVAAQAVDRLRPIDALRRTTISEIEEIAVELRRSPRPGFRLDPSSRIAILAINLLQQLECYYVLGEYTRPMVRCNNCKKLQKQFTQ